PQRRLIHPEHLQRVRIGSGRGRHRDHPAQSRRGIFIRPAIAQPARRRQTPIPHNHSRDGFERRQALALIPRDGRRYAGARARPGPAQHHRFRDGRSTRRRATALQTFRQRTRARIGDRRGNAKGPRSQGSPAYLVTGNVRRLSGDYDRSEDGGAVRRIGSAQGRLRDWLVITVAGARWYNIGQGCRKEAEMEVNVSPETESQLKEIAEQMGARVADYAGFLLEQKLRENGAPHPVNGVEGATEKDEDTDPDALTRAIDELLNQTPEEVEQARLELLRASRPPRPLPEGKTFFDGVWGKWPGDETDEQVFEALRKVS